MKTSIFILLLLLVLTGSSLSAQDSNYSERHGNTLNLGFGVGGYSGYYGNTVSTLPVFNINYEFDVARNFTLAPFASFVTYHQNYYRETVIPLGGKGTYYFDQLLGAGKDWDFYLAGSLGFTVVNTTWDNGYSEAGNYHTINPLFLDFHAGAEYHINRKLGLFLDLSTGVSTIGIAFH